MAKTKKAGPSPSVPTSKQPPQRQPSTTPKKRSCDVGDTKMSDVLKKTPAISAMKPKPKPKTKTEKQLAKPKSNDRSVVVPAKSLSSKFTKSVPIVSVAEYHRERPSSNTIALKSGPSCEGLSAEIVKKMPACFKQIKPEPASSSAARDDKSNCSVNLGSKSHEPMLSPTLPIDVQVETQFYGTMVLLYTLGQIQDHHTRRPRYYGGLEHEASELRRSFINHLAYICDYQKGGETVTAIALQVTFQGVRFWIATNQGVKQKVRDFLEDVLHEVAGASVDMKKALEKTLLAKIVEFNKHRLDFYSSWIRRNKPACLSRLANMATSSESQHQKKNLNTLRQWLQKIGDNDHLELVKECFNARSSNVFSTLTQLTASGTPNQHLFENLRHFLGRLGEHKKSSMVLVAAAISFPAIFDNYEIETLDSPPCSPVVTSIGEITFQQWAEVIFSNSEEVDHYRLILERLYETTSGDIARRLRDEARFKTRVHAEILLVDAFYWRHLEFFDDDAYVGCSKPACFSCFHYILCHPGNYAVPACHNKLYLSWRPPDVLLNTQTAAVAAKVREHILNKMLPAMRSQLRKHLDGRNPTKRVQFDSTTGTSSSLYAALLDTGLLLNSERSCTVTHSLISSPDNGEVAYSAQRLSTSDLGPVTREDETDDEGKWHRRRVGSLKTLPLLSGCNS